MVALNKEEEAMASTKRCCALKLPLLLCKAWWFFFGAIGTIYMAFRYPFIVSVGLSAREAGVISAVSSIVAGTTAPLWGALADKTGCRRLVMIFLCFSFTVIMCAVPWSGSKPPPSQIKCITNNNNNNNNINNIINNTNSFQQGLTNSSLDHTNSTASLAGGEAGCVDTEDSMTLFYTMLVLWVLSSCCLLPMYGLFQSLTMNVVQHTRTSQGCGDQMMYMSIGAGTISLLAGLFADSFKHPALTSYGAIYLLVPPMMLPLLPASFILYRYTKWGDADVEADDDAKKCPEETEKLTTPTPPETGDEQPAEVQMSRMRILKNLLSNPTTLILLLTVLVTGVLMSFINSFLFLLMKDEMNASKTSMGLSALVQCFSATFVYFFIERTIPILGGLIPCIEFSVLSYVIRFVTTSYIKNPWLVVIPMLSSGLGESLSTVAMMKYIHQVSPVHVHNTMFTLMSCLKFALGPCLSHIVGSQMYYRYKGPALYRGAGAVGTMWLVVLFVYFHLGPLIRKRVGSKKEPTALPQC